MAKERGVLKHQAINIYVPSSQSLGGLFPELHAGRGHNKYLLVDLVSSLSPRLWPGKMCDPVMPLI